MSLARLARLAAATVLVAAAGTALTGSPVAAATCSSDTGVSVVVDASGLGGATATSCVADGGGDSAASVLEVHHDLTRASQFPGAVCRVDGAPADAECRNMPPADAYWGLFWSDGSGGWVYSSQGVDSLKIPDGGSVAFAWQDGGDQDPPGVAPPQQDPGEPTPSSPPAGNGSDNGGSGGAGSPGNGTGSGGPTAGGSATAPSASPGTSASGSPTPGEDKSDGGEPGKAKPSADKGKDREGGGKGKAKRRGDEESASPSDEASATTDAVLTADPAADAGADGLPTWVAPVGIAGLFGVAGAVALLRRRSLS